MMLKKNNPMGKVLLSVLIFEAVCTGLAVPVMINVDGVGLVSSVVFGGGTAVLALLATALMRVTRVGYPLGWLTQVACVALGLVTTGMFFVGGMFAALWIISFVLGRRLEAMASRAEGSPTAHAG
ncbi:MAG: DUF4233 domain-containing protein [Propionibacteriales bacterium]|nr:DUF4233 domain-containing protein [Propionibacteriales bacterium]